MIKKLTSAAIDTAVSRGASYADIRVLRTVTEKIVVKNGRIGEMVSDEDIGFGVRVIVNGAWGFAAGNGMNKSDVEKITSLAVEVAQASAMLKTANVKLAPEPPHRERWHTPILIDPFSIPFETKLDFLMRINRILRKNSKIKVAESSMSFVQQEIIFASSEGSFIEQNLTRSGAGYKATAVDNGEVQFRSFPCSFNGEQSLGLGYEIVENMGLLENAERIREEAVELLTAPQCPRGKKNLIINGDQLALQIHESVGHPSELDRAIGMEANFAGTSFATVDKLNNFKYGSDLVNLVCDSTLPAGLATRGFDDDGVRSHRWHLVDHGDFVGYQLNRELAHVIKAGRSTSNSRADSWRSIPIVRMTNLSLLPGDWEYDDLIADTKDGLIVETNKSWSIDQQRLNFQFGSQIGWLVKNGKIKGVVKNPTYQGITPKFWRSCDAICNHNHWTLWGVGNCGKGEPMQTAAMSHGAAPARFRNVEVGIS